MGGCEDMSIWGCGDVGDVCLCELSYVVALCLEANHDGVSMIDMGSHASPIRTGVRANNLLLPVHCFHGVLLLLYVHSRANYFCVCVP